MPAVRQIRVLDPLSLGHHLGRPSLVSQPGHDPSNTRGQIVGEFRTRRPRGSRKCPHDHVGAGWQARQLPRHQVAQLPGHPMADHGSPHGTTHDESRTRRQGGLRGTGVHDQRCARQHGIPRASRRGSPQRAGSFDARAARPARLLGRDTSATLAATCGEHGTTRPGAHAGAEAVRACTPTVVRLESALHGVSSLRLGDRGRRALGMLTNGRTDLFLGTKVRNSPRTGQTRVRQSRMLGRPSRSRAGTAVIRAGVGPRSGRPPTCGKLLHAAIRLA